MTEYKNIKNLWSQQVSNQNSIEELYVIINVHKKKGQIKLIKTNIMLLLTCGFIFYIWYWFKPEMMTTKIGIIIMSLSMLIFLVFYNQLFSLFHKIDNAQNNNEYLKSFFLLKTKQRFIQTALINLYFVFFTIGILLYMFEYASKMQLFWATTTYFIVLAWLGYNWFYMRPKKIVNQNSKLNELIKNIENLETQLNTKDN